jgi:hypothetical protein
MKKLFSVLAMLIAVQFSYAQWTTSGNDIYNSNSGNVGIGNSAPNTKLTITPGLAAPVTYGGKILNPGVWVNITSSRSGYTTYTTNDYLNSGNGNAGFLSVFPFDNSTNSNDKSWKAFRLMTGVTLADQFWVDKYGDGYFAGNVGIGTTSPLNKLDVQGGNASVYNTGAATGLAIGSGATGKTVLSLSTSADANGYGVISSVSASGSTYGNTVVNPNGGNVAIGTTDPQGHKLAVNGDIIATKITVKPYGNWPDFVFKPTYNLPSLSEVKSYIDQNQHLPDMPSAATVEKDGQDIGEMNKLLLKKVEELTLYVIEKDKQAANQQNQIDQLKQSLEALTKEIHKD